MDEGPELLAPFSLPASVPSPSLRLLTGPKMLSRFGRRSTLCPAVCRVEPHMCTCAHPRACTAQRPGRSAPQNESSGRLAGPQGSCLAGPLAGGPNDGACVIAPQHALACCCSWCCCPWSAPAGSWTGGVGNTADPHTAPAIHSKDGAPSVWRLVPGFANTVIALGAKDGPLPPSHFLPDAAGPLSTSVQPPAVLIPQPWGCSQDACTCSEGRMTGDIAK